MLTKYFLEDICTRLHYYYNAFVPPTGGHFYVRFFIELYSRSTLIITLDKKDKSINLQKIF